jgi:hypothetical protein
MSTMAASDVEDGEIIGEVNENYQNCVSEPELHAAKQGAAATSAVAADKQQLPGWEEEHEPAGHVKRRPKKEKKKKQKDAAGPPAAAGNGHAAADAAGSNGQQATYVNVYGSNVSISNSIALWYTSKHPESSAGKRPCQHNAHVHVRLC